MWKVTFAESHRALDVVPGIGRISPMQLSCTPKSTSKKKGAKSGSTDSIKNSTKSDTTKRVATTEPASSSDGGSNRVIKSLLDSPPTYWTESAVYAHLCNHKLVQPTLKDVHEFTLRRHGSEKLRCTFLNNYNEECTVWVSGILVFNSYPKIYARAHSEFFHKFKRA